MGTMKNKFMVILFVVSLLLFGLHIQTLAQEQANENVDEGFTEAPFLIGSGDFEYLNGIYYEAEFRFPYGVTYNPHTDMMLIADLQNHRIRQMNMETFEVTTLAGTTEQVDRFGFPAGGHVDGDADEAMFNRPRGLAVAPNGAIYVADTGNHSIRQIYDGQVYTVAGSGLRGHKDDVGLEAEFWNPTDIVIDSQGNLLVSDTLNHVIRKINQEGNVTTYAGEPGNTKLLFEPNGLAIDDNDLLYVADSANQQIKVIDKDGSIRVLAGMPGELDQDTGYWLGEYVNGRSEDARFNFPRGVALSPDGFVFVADSWTHTIRAISPSGRVYTVAGTGVSGFDWDEQFITEFDGPSGITYALGYLFVTDYWNNRVVAIPVMREFLRPIIDFTNTDSAVPVYIDGTEINFPDVEPFIDNDRVRVPLRFVVEEWGAGVSWDEDNRSVIVTVGGQEFILSEADGDFFIRDDRSIVQLRTLVDKLGFYIEWREDHRAVVIETFTY
ncbi:stalk domain-containing protein [Desulfuribacillus alkaliarsenatis]|uniref:Copper amine oxidase-like N-terminal domain-containing protein n=1 Tax=Desulfuribacillus alkaliarsenatis TaxID=766136 RepID=A0A1E5G1R6_9FIRM|nr:stalk domain-containing protein [Desulfuribacillus alkaliarsenatis]OEF96857.1 hypothetical protein BHF68_07295 [Desulfuribacillus alkaliarsenatis]